jgi:hypothetical protein
MTAETLESIVAFLISEARPTRWLLRGAHTRTRRGEIAIRIAGAFIFERAGRTQSGGAVQHGLTAALLQISQLLARSTAYLPHALIDPCAVIGDSSSRNGLFGGGQVVLHLCGQLFRTARVRRRHDLSVSGHAAQKYVTHR